MGRCTSRSQGETTVKIRRLDSRPTFPPRIIYYPVDSHIDARDLRYLYERCLITVRNEIAPSRDLSTRVVVERLSKHKRLLIREIGGNDRDRSSISSFSFLFPLSLVLSYNIQSCSRQWLILLCWLVLP